MAVETKKGETLFEAEKSKFKAQESVHKIEQQQPQQSASNAEKPRLLVTQYERQQQQLNYAKQQELFQQQQLERHKQKVKLVSATPPKNTQQADYKTSAKTRIQNSPNEHNRNREAGVAEKANNDGDTKGDINSAESSFGVQDGKQAIPPGPANNRQVDLSNRSACADVNLSTSMPATSSTRKQNASQSENALQQKTGVYLKANTQIVQPKHSSADHVRAKSAVTLVRPSAEKQAPKPENKLLSQPHNQSATPKTALGSKRQNVKTSSVDIPEPVTPYYQNVSSASTATLQKDASHQCIHKAVCTCRHTSVEQPADIWKQLRNGQTRQDSGQESGKEFEESTGVSSRQLNRSPSEQEGCSTLEEDKDNDLHSLSQTSSESDELSTYEAIVAPTKFLSNLKRKVGNFLFGKKSSSKDVEAGDDADKRKRKQPKKETGSSINANGNNDEIKISHQRADTGNSASMATSACNHISVFSQQVCPIHSQPNYAHIATLQCQELVDQRASMQTDLTSKPAINQQSSTTLPSNPPPNGQNFVSQPTTNPTQLRYTPPPTSLLRPQPVPTSQMRASAYGSQNVVPTANSAIQKVPTANSAIQKVPTAKSAIQKIPTANSVPQTHQVVPAKNKALQSQEVVTANNNVPYPQNVKSTKNMAPQSLPTSNVIQQPQNAIQTVVLQTNAARSVSQLQGTAQSAQFQTNGKSIASQLHQSAVGVAVLQTNAMNSASKLQAVTKKCRNFQTNTVQQNKNMSTRSTVPTPSSEETQIKSTELQSVGIQQKTMKQGNFTTKQVSQAKLQDKQQMSTTTPQEEAAAQSKITPAQANEDMKGTRQPKPTTSQPRVVPQQNALEKSLAQSKMVLSQSTTASQKATQAVNPLSVKAAPLLKGETKMNGVAQQKQQTFSKTQNPSSTQGKTNAVTRQTGQSQTKSSLLPKQTTMTNTAAQSKLVAPHSSQGNDQQSHKAAPLESKSNKEKEYKGNSLGSLQAAAKNTNGREAEPPQQPDSVEKSPLASQTITKGASKASSESKKEIKLKSSPGPSVPKPRRRLTFQEKQNDNVEPSPDEKPSTTCVSKKVPVKLEVVKPEDIDVAIAIALDKVPYSPTRTVKVMPQIPPPQLDDYDDVVEPCEPVILMPKRRARGGKGKYKNVNLRKSVNCCCENSCSNCTCAEEWDSLMSVHNRRKR